MTAKAPLNKRETDMSVSITVENVNRKFGAVEALQDINLHINEGEFVCLLGPSGCGKSTLLRLIAGLDLPTGGRIKLAGKDAAFIPPSKRNFGIVFQSYALFPNLTAFENVAYGLRNKKMSRKNITEIVDRHFDMIKLSYAKNRYPAQLSGGEQQRVALARALVQSPDFLLLDEPLSALDAKVRAELRKEICRIQKQLNVTTIMVTHDQEEALTMADRIIVMNKARIMQSGSPQEVYEQPVNQFVADFIGSINFINEDNKNLLAVRPENIYLSLEHDNSALRAELSDVEFRGAFLRVLAKVTHVNRHDILMIDIPFREAKSLGLETGKIVYIRLPEDDLISVAAS
jgi:iron(III) transport system ATP-binding protein